MEYYLEVLGSRKGELFCLGSVLEHNFDSQLVEKKGMEYFE